MVVPRSPLVGQREQHDERDARGDERVDPPQQGGLVTALDQVADEHDDGVGRPSHERRAVDECAVDVGATAELGGEPDSTGSPCSASVGSTTAVSKSEAGACRCGVCRRSRRRAGGSAEQT